MNRLARRVESRLVNTLDARRARVADAFALDDQVLVIGAGSLLPVPGTDQFYPFLCHPEYRYLADRYEPDHVLVFEPGQGWTDYVPPVTASDTLWTGATQGSGEPISSLPARLAGKTVAMLGSRVRGVLEDASLGARLRRALDVVRRRKDADEIARIQEACNATAAGHAALLASLRPGLTERHLCATLESGFFHAGGERTAYDSIVASGPNAAVLHYTPGDRTVLSGEMLLVDAGASVRGYASDVTRTHPVSGTFTPFQQDLYDTVLAAEREGIAGCRAGVEYVDLHLRCCVTLARGLVDMGILRGNPESLVEQDAHALFFPHGLGHALGLAVHDAGGREHGRPRSDRFGLRFLRADLKLPTDFVVTIEPGLYFVRAILEDPARRAEHIETVDWEKVDQHLDAGGIRIEDDVLVTDSDPIVLTAAIPK